MKKFILLASMASMLFAACSDDDNTDSVFDKTPTDIAFTSAANENYTWKAGDEISIVMKKTGWSLAANTVLLANENPVSIYAANGENGEFTAKSENDTLFFPKNGDAVDFIAFYPKSYPVSATEPTQLSNIYGTDDAVGTYIVHIDVLDQSSQEKLNFMYSNNLTNRSKKSRNAELQFASKMSRVAFYISAGDGMTDADLEGIKTYFYGPSTVGVFNLSTAKYESLSHPLSIVGQPPRNFMIEMKASTDGKLAVATLLPEKVASRVEINASGSYENTRIEFKLKSGKSVSYSLPEGINLEEGKTHAFDVIIGTLTTTVNPRP